LLKSSIGISKEQFTSKRKTRFSSGMKFDIDIITKGTDDVTTKGTEVIADVEEIADIIEKKNWGFFFIS